jgi:cytochrome c-type biogenesis protein CcmH
LNRKGKQPAERKAVLLIVRRFSVSLRRIWALWIGTSILALILAGLAAGPGLAQTPQPVPSDNQVNAVARELYCPVCENIPLDVCGTQACAQWRDLIRLKLSQGWSKDQIKQYFAAQYGDRVLAQPPARGLNLLVYILPPVLFLLGAMIVYRILNRMRKPALASPPAPGSTSADDDPYLKRMEEEYKRAAGKK